MRTSILDRVVRHLLAGPFLLALLGSLLDAETMNRLALMVGIAALIALVLCGYGFMTIGSDKKSVMSLRTTVCILGSALSTGIALMIGFGAVVAYVAGGSADGFYHIPSFLNWTICTIGTVFYGLHFGHWYITKPPRLTVHQG